MSKIAFIFPGQGAQYVGMGKDLVEAYPAANEVFEKASSAINMDIKKLCFEGPEESLVETENAQPAILTISTAVAKVLYENGIKPEVTAGLSLGEYTSLVLAGAMEFEDAIRLVKLRGKYMQEVVPLGAGTMAAVKGEDRAEFEKILAAAKDYGIIEVANYNSPAQLVVSGEVNAVGNFCTLMEAAENLTAMPLSVSAPFHCSMLVPAGEKLEKELENIIIKDTQLPVISNVSADYYTSSEEIKKKLVLQVSSSVLWENSVVRMLEDGVDTFIEVGPGRSLSSFAKATARSMKKEITTYSVEKPKDIEKLIGAFNKQE